MFFTVSRILMATEPYTPPYGYYIYPFVGDSAHQVFEYDEVCSPCSNVPWDKDPFYGYIEDSNTVPPTYSYLARRFVYYKEINGVSTDVGDILVYYKFKKHKLCIPGYSYEAILIDIWKICFTVDDPNTPQYESLPFSDIVAIAPSASEMIRLAHKEIGTNLKEYFHHFASVNPGVPGGTSDWWKNSFWGTDNLDNALVFLNPCSMQINYLSFDGGVTCRDICYEKCSDNCCKITYIFKNTFEDYDDNGTTRKCTNHWQCTRSEIFSQECKSYGIINCEQICSNSLLYFQVGTEYIKDEVNKTPGCSVCTGYIPYPKATLYDLNSLYNKDIGQIRIYNSTGELIQVLDDISYKNFEFDNSYNVGIYFIQIFDKEMKFIENRKYLVK